MNFNGIKRVFGFWNEKFLTILSFVFVYGYLFFGLILPFLRFNKLVNWDLAGLYFSVWYQKLYLFPKIIGWNPFFFLGYPQHQFYPPLFAYITSALSFITGLTIAFKIVFVSILILTPLSFYYFARSFRISKKISSALMVVMFGILFLFPNSFYGGNMASTFNIGLITHSAGMMLFFFYFGALERSFKGNKNYILPSLLFVLIILTHIVATFAATFVFIAYFICYFNKKYTLSFSIKHLGIVFLLTAFWFVPFVMKSNWLAALPVGINQPYLLMGIIAFWLLILFFKNEDRYLPIAIFFVLVFLFSFLSIYFIDLPIHLYRFMMFLYLIVPLIFVAVLSDKFRYLIYSILFVTGVLLVVFSSPIHPEGSSAINISKIDDKYLNNLNDRFLILPSIVNEAIPHVLQNEIPMMNNIHSVKGLYVESAMNGKYVFYLDHELNPKNSFTWWESIPTDKMNYNYNTLRKIVSSQLKIFNINYIVGQKDMMTEQIVHHNYSVPESLIGNLSYLNISNFTNINKKFANLSNVNNSFINYSENTIEIGNYSWDDLTFYGDNLYLGEVSYELNEFYSKLQFVSEYKDEKYFLYSCGNSSLIEVLDYIPNVVLENWNSESVNWFLSENVTKGVMVNEKVPLVKGTGNETIRVDYMSKRQDNIKFYVNSSKEVPVLIKISAFPNWKAYQDGKEIKIYTASPYIMLIYAHGNVELRYENIFWDSLGNWLSIIGLLVLIFRQRSF